MFGGIKKEKVGRMITETIVTKIRRGREAGGNWGTGTRKCWRAVVVDRCDQKTSFKGGNFQIIKKILLKYSQRYCFIFLKS